MTCQHTDCATNPRPAVIGTRLCGLHLRGLQADVADIARVTSLLGSHRDALISPSAGGTSGRNVPSSRPPMRLAVVLSPQTVQAVCGWASDLLQLDDDTHDLERAGRALLAHVQRIAEHEAVATISEELRDAATECRAVLPDQRWNTKEQDDKPSRVARCTEPDPRDQTRACGGDVLWIPATLAVRCSRCGWETEADGWRRKAHVLGPFGLERRTLDRWIKAGRVAYVNGKVNVDDIRAVIRAQRDTRTDEACGA